MGLHRYFEVDDGSLPEIEVQFGRPDQVPRAFARLFSLGAVDVTVGGSRVCIPATDSERPFRGPSDAELVASGALQSFHIVLSEITLDGTALPDLGVLVETDGLTLDYRMGPEWGSAQVEGLVLLLREFCGLGASITVPWWGADGTREFKECVGGT